MSPVWRIRAQFAGGGRAPAHPYACALLETLPLPWFFMPILQVIVLGIIQGLTEFLPISSTAHLVVIPRLLGWPDQGLAFDIALHVGTLAAVILYFFRDWMHIVANGFGLKSGRDPELRRNPMLLWFLVV